MTTFTLAAFKDRPLPSPESHCTFCSISSGSTPAHIVYESKHCLAFLDILPIRRGHVLVVPRRHVDNVAGLDVGDAGETEEMMRAVVVAARGVGRALGDERLQVITNQGYGQVVPHVSLEAIFSSTSPPLLTIVPSSQLHFHIVPAPPLPGSSPSSSSSASSSKPLQSPSRPNPLSLIGHGREELDEDEAVDLARRIRKAVDEVVKEEEARRERSKL